MLSSGGLSDESLLFPGTAMFAALVATTIQVCLAESQAHGSLDVALVADRLITGPTAHTSDVHG